MKKILIGFLTIIVIAAIWFGQSRTFYCINGMYFTVWKTFNDVCYVIPRKYYGLIKPKDNYIQTTNTSQFTIYWKYENPNSITIRSGSGAIKIMNIDTSKIQILTFNEADLEKIYGSSRKYYEPKSGINLIDLDIKEDYVRGRYAKILHSCK